MSNKALLAAIRARRFLAPKGRDRRDVRFVIACSRPLTNDDVNVGSRGVGEGEPSDDAHGILV